MEERDAGAGFCEKRLENVSAYLRRLVDTSQVGGAAALVIRRGVKAYKRAFGFQNIERGVPLRDDAIFRIYSMSKTVTVVCAMTLYERGLFKLHDPIGDLLPRYRDVKVAESDGRGAVKLSPAKRPITFEHLFTMTSGIPYPGEESYSARLMAEVYARARRSAAKGNAWDTARIVDAAARVPLCFHPGDQWMYGFSHDVLGRLVEVLSGRKLSEYMEETIFRPLGMSDTAFFVPADKQDRVVTPYYYSPKKLNAVSDLVKDLGNDPASPEVPAFESGGGGLNSTLEDVGRYASMLLNFGKLDGTRILSRKTVELIRQNHVTPELIKRYGFPSQAGYGYGLGVRTMMDKREAGINGSDGEWAWDGMMGTWYCVDPAEDLAAVFLVQRLPGGNEDLPKRFIQTVYGAIDD